jgi:uncharacterized protein (TIGR03437 family)
MWNTAPEGKKPNPESIEGRRLGVYWSCAGCQNGNPRESPRLNFIGDVPAEIQYVGGVLGQVAGLMQINARLAAGTGDGRQPLLLRIGQAASPTGVFLIVG